jgi:hypothetical protein
MWDVTSEHFDDTLDAHQTIYIFQKFSQHRACISVLSSSQFSRVF